MNDLLILTQSDYHHDPRIRKEVFTATSGGIGTFVVCYGVSERDSTWTKPFERVRKTPYILHSLRSKFKNKFVKRIVETQNIETTNESVFYKTIRLVFDSFFIYIGSQIDLYIKIHKLNYKTLQATDLNTLLTGVIYKHTHGAKLVYDAHELWTEMYEYNPKWMNKLIRIYESILIKHTDVVITVNESIAKELEDRYDISGVVVIMNCPVYQSVSVIKSPDVTNVIYQGRYTKDRGLEDLILAATHLPHHIHVYMRGMDGYGGGYEEELKTFARSHGNRVTFLPPVGVEDLVTSLSGFNIGIVPYKPVSLNNYYATPNKVFEYIMAGLPVCVSNLPELWDIVTLNTVGSVFNPNDPKDIARSITAVESRYHVFSHNAQCAAKTKYNWETQSNQLINIYTKN